MKIKHLILTAAVILPLSCEKYDGYIGTKLGGEQSPIGEVGNTFTFSSPAGVGNASASVTDLTDGISTITWSVEITDSKLATLATYYNKPTVVGKTYSGTMKARITSEGVETIHSGGNLILVRYDDEVGDSYTLKTDNTTIKREIISKSTEDDYFWGWMMIKTMVVKETGHDTPGLSYIEYVFNHRFGLVGTKVYFADGTNKSMAVYSYNSN